MLRFMNIFFPEDIRINVQVKDYGKRQKRSTDEFPDDMDIDLPLDGSHVTLSLHRNKRINTRVPVTVQRDGRIVYQFLKQSQVSIHFTRFFDSQLESNLKERAHQKVNVSFLTNNLSANLIKIG